VFALLITGPPGAGKTEVLAALSDVLVADDIRHASIEVEALTSAHPALDDDQWTAPVRAVCGLYREFGYELLLASATVETQPDLDAVLAAIDAAHHAIVRLEADPDTLRKRIVEREPDGWPGLDELLAAAERIAPEIAHLDGIALVLSTERAQPQAVADSIRGAFPDYLRRASLRPTASGAGRRCQRAG
jgi:DNA polymerase III delta prime subunit